MPTYKAERAKPPTATGERRLGAGAVVRAGCTIKGFDEREGSFRDGYGNNLRGRIRGSSEGRIRSGSGGLPEQLHGWIRSSSGCGFQGTSDENRGLRSKSHGYAWRRRTPRPMPPTSAWRLAAMTSNNPQVVTHIEYYSTGRFLPRRSRRLSNRRAYPNDLLRTGEIPSEEPSSKRSDPPRKRQSPHAAWKPRPTAFAPSTPGRPGAAASAPHPQRPGNRMSERLRGFHPLSRMSARNAPSTAKLSTRSTTGNSQKPNAWPSTPKSGAMASDPT